MPTNIATLEHPNYTNKLSKWLQYRLVGTGGEEFLNYYLYKRPSEENAAFQKRKDITYIPSFAKSALNQIRNSIRQRLTSVKRIGGSFNYQAMVRGFAPGVDRKYSSMNKFIGGVVLDELTMMGAVGVYVDAPRSNNTSLMEDPEHIPYLYVYKVENIKSWAVDPTDPNKFTRLLLVDYVEDVDEDYGLATDFVERYRYYSLDNGKVSLTIFDDNGTEIEKIPLDLDQIPFVFLQLSDSLLSDVARHQITLLNLGSSDVNYIWEGNVTFLAEQYDPNAPENYYKHTAEDEDGTTEGSEATLRERKRFLGVNRAIRVPSGLEYPQYISPDSAPLEASMKKQTDLKNQIVELVNQNLKTITARSSSADSKQIDERREEDGLKVIGDELEHAENQIALFWSKYEASEPALVIYPVNYQFKTDKDKREEASELANLLEVSPSLTAQKEIAKVIVNTLLDSKIKPEILDKIYKEIDAAPSAISDPDKLYQFAENGFLPVETVLEQMGFKDAKELAKLAQEQKVERASQIALMQAKAAQGNSMSNNNPAARGVEDLSATPKKDAEEEKNV